LPSNPVVDRQYYAEHLGAKIHHQNLNTIIIFSFLSTGGAVCGMRYAVGFERTSRGIAFYICLDADHLLAVEERRIALV
jgi:hypothetical protein